MKRILGSFDGSWKVLCSQQRQPKYKAWCLGAIFPCNHFTNQSKDVLTTKRLFRNNVLGFGVGFDGSLEQPYTNSLHRR